MGPLPGTKWDPSLGQTGLSLFNSTVKSPFCPVCPWDGWGFVPGTIVPQGPSENVYVFSVYCFFLRNENSAQRGSFWPDIPADIRRKLRSGAPNPGKTSILERTSRADVHEKTPVWKTWGWFSVLYFLLPNYPYQFAAFFRKKNSIFRPVVNHYCRRSALLCIVFLAWQGSLATQRALPY